MLEVKQLSHVYSAGTAFEAAALEDINMTIADGEFLAVVGHTGSGKSTLVQHFNGLLRPTSGQILIDGEDLNADKDSRNRLRRKIGLVFQYPEYQLFEETVAKDIAFGPKNQGLSAEEIDRRVRESMAAVQLDYAKYAERSPFELSGGQMRRVAIAGVLAMEPEILVLDEPAAGLDPAGRELILGILEDYHAKRKTTVIMVSHSMDDVARLATRIAVMSRGKLIAFDEPRRIFAQREMMEQAHLGVPEASALGSALRARGVDIPEDLYRPAELQEAILCLWKGVRA